MSWARIESDIYWPLFVAAFLAAACWESFRPKRELSAAVEKRWSRNGAIALVSMALSLLYHISPVILAFNLSGGKFGLLNKTLLSFPIRCALAFVLLDMARYWVHRAHHSFTFLWRLHQVHHSDPDFDVSTGVRSHPFESLVVQGSYLAAVALLGPPPLAVLLFDLTLSVQVWLSHSNASLPQWIERILRPIFITPDLHRIHHSVEVSEQCSNLGELFPWWDRLFGTYLAEPAAGQDAMEIGLKGCQDEGALSLAFMLLQPFRPDPQQLPGPLSDLGSSAPAGAILGFIEPRIDVDQ